MEIEKDFDIKIYGVLREICEQLKYSPIPSNVLITVPYLLNKKSINSVGYKKTRILEILEKQNVLKIIRRFDYQVGEEDSVDSAGLQYELKIKTKQYEQLLKEYNNHFGRSKLYLSKYKDHYIVKFVKPSGDEFEYKFRKNSNYHRLIEFLANNQGEKFKFSQFQSVLNEQSPSRSEGSSIKNRVNSTVKDIYENLNLKIDDLFIRDNGYGFKDNFDIVIPSK